MGFLLEILVILLLVLALPALFILGLVRMMVGERHGGSRSDRDSEARMLQDLNRTAQRLEERVEALETLLLDERDRSAAHARNRFEGE